MTLFAIIKLVMYLAACGLIGWWIAKYRNRRDLAQRPRIQLTNFETSGNWSIKGKLELAIPKGESVTYMGIDHGQSSANFTSSSKAAAKWRVLGYDVHVLRFTRDKDSCQLKAASANNPMYPYNFLTESFTRKVPDKDTYVQIFS